MNTINEYHGIFGLLSAQAAVNPQRVGLMVDGHAVTFGELLDMAHKVAGALFDQGIRKGDRVGLVMPSSIEWMAVFWGIQALGAVCVPMAPGEGREEIANVFKLTSVKVCFASRRFQVNEFEKLFCSLKPELPELSRVIIPNPEKRTELITDFETILNQKSRWRPEMSPDLSPTDLYALMATSGTTGVPKIIPKQHASSIEYFAAYTKQYPIASSDTFFSAMPPFHMLSLSYKLVCMMRGACAVFQSYFDPEGMLETIERTHATMVLLSTTNAKMMMSEPKFDSTDFSSISTFLFSGEFLPDEVANEFYKARDFQVMNIIGSTEANAYLVWDSNKDRGLSVSVLTPLECVETALMNEDGAPCSVGERAEIFVSHKDILSGYYKNKEATSLSIVTSSTNKNWFKTGDLAIPRPDGRYQFAGRKKRIIKRGATLIYPEEIECFLLTHPEINAAAILKEEDETAGETMKAFIELRKDSNLSVFQIVQFCQGRLSNIKIPETILIVDELPRETGKIQLKKLKNA